MGRICGGRHNGKPMRRSHVLLTFLPSNLRTVPHVQVRADQPDTSRLAGAALGRLTVAWQAAAAQSWCLDRWGYLSRDISDRIAQVLGPTRLTPSAWRRVDCRTQVWNIARTPAAFRGCIATAALEAKSPANQ